ncbi:MAG: right-handed parallel beta-helix repeat-containing protein, partial [Planctomycetota bacterium]
FYDPNTGLTYTFDGNAIDHNNINADPNFAGGPLGDFYLDQDVSPAVDSGSGTASDVNIGMDIYTTDPNGGLDINQVDRGYHYPDVNGISQLYELTLTVAGGQGTLEATRPREYVAYDANTNTYTYYAGTVVTLTAMPDTVYRMGSWSGTMNDASTAQTNVVIMLGDRDVSVEFRKPRTFLVGQDQNYPSIQHALDEALDGDIIVLARGVYTPPSPFGTLTINRGVTLTSDTPAGEENSVADTVLSGYNFFITNPGPERAIIDGITIRFGRTFILNSSPIIRNCVFTDIRRFGGTPPNPPDPPTDGGPGGSVLGGAIVMLASSPDIQNCSFTNCSVTGGTGAPGDDREMYGCDGGWAGKGYGGAIYIDANSEPTIIDCSFDNCFARGGNGGDGGDATGDFPIQGGRGGNWEWAGEIDADPNDPNFLFSVWGWWDGWLFRAFHPEEYWRYSGYGGAIYCESLGSPQFINCTFSNNSSFGGVSGIGGSPSLAMGTPVPNRNLNIENFGGSIYVRNGSPEFIDCTISDSSADTSLVSLPDDVYVSFGGAVCVEDSAPNFVNCTISNSEACRGGGMCWFDSDVSIVDCNLAESRAYQGAGLYTTNSTGTVTGSTFFRNEASDASVPPTPDPNAPFDPGNILGRGGGYYSASSSVWVADSIFKENVATASGGGIYLFGSSQDPTALPVLHNCLIINNLAGRDGGGISSNWYAEPTISNCTIADNEATGAYAAGGGLYGSFGSHTTVVDSIIWGNEGIWGSQIAVGTGAMYEPERRSTIDISYSDVQGPVERTNSIDVVLAIDTTGSMWDDIDAVKEAAAEIVSEITEEFPDYRIAIVDYRDFNQPNRDPEIESPYGDADIDYPYYDDLVFDTDLDRILDGIDSITTGFGGDGPESVLAALMHC